MMTKHRSDGDGQPAFRPLESITAVAILGVLGLALGLVALMRPPAVVATHELSFNQSGTFSYSASAPANSVYGAAGLRSGDPILLGSVGPVRAKFVYRLTPPAPSAVRGTVALNAEVEFGLGLSRAFPVAAAHAFTGNMATASGVLPLDTIRSYLDAATRQLGTAGGSPATVTLKPTVKFSGTIGGHELSPQTFAPVLTFTVSGATLAISGRNSASGQNSAAAPSDPAAEPSDALHVSSKASVSYHASEPNTVSLLFVHPTVESARIAGFSVAGLCLLLCLWLARPLRAGRSPGDRARIRALYGARLVRVEAIASHYGPIAEVTSIGALVELAKRYEAMIMLVAESDSDAYLVWDNGMLYRYRAPRRAAAGTTRVTDGVPEPDAVVDTARLQPISGLDARAADGEVVQGAERLLRDGHGIDSLLNGR